MNDLGRGGATTNRFTKLPLFLPSVLSRRAGLLLLSLPAIAWPLLRGHLFVPLICLTQPPLDSFSLGVTGTESVFSVALTGHLSLPPPRAARSVLHLACLSV